MCIIEVLLWNKQSQWHQTIYDHLSACKQFNRLTLTHKWSHQLIIIKCQTKYKWCHIYKKKLLKASLCTRKNVFMILNFPWDSFLMLLRQLDTWKLWNFFFKSIKEIISMQRAWHSPNKSPTRVNSQAFHFITWTSLTERAPPYPPPGDTLGSSVGWALGTGTSAQF